MVFYTPCKLLAETVLPHSQEKPNINPQSFYLYCQPVKSPVKLY